MSCTPQTPGLAFFATGAIFGLILGPVVAIFLLGHFIVNHLPQIGAGLILFLLFCQLLRVARQ